MRPCGALRTGGRAPIALTVFVLYGFTGGRDNSALAARTDSLLVACLHELAQLAPGPVALVGDLNADPVDGESVSGAIDQLLKHARVHPAVATGELIPASNGGAANGIQHPDHRGDPQHDTAEWGLRVDYVLPSSDLLPRASGIFWPANGEPGEHLVAKMANGKSATDHQLVWVDIELTVDAK